MSSAGALLAAGAAKLRAAGIEDARREARLLLSHCMAVSAEQLFAHPETTVPAAAAARFEAVLERRVGREPLSHILGVREFWGLTFKVSGAVLDPRPDSESIVALTLDRIAPKRILDLGTGSGCLLCALLHELPSASGVGVDRSAEALRVAAANAEALGLSARARFLRSDWGAALDERFELIVANPPYIRSGEIEALAPEVARHEPRAALDGGADGLDAYRAIAAELPRLLDEEGLAVFEIGAGQAEDVAGILEAAGYPLLEARADLGGHVRALAVCRIGAKIRVGQSTSPR